MTPTQQTLHYTTSKTGIATRNIQDNRREHQDKAFEQTVNSQGL